MNTDFTQLLFVVKYLNKVYLDPIFALILALHVCLIEKSVFNLTIFFLFPRRKLSFSIQISLDGILVINRMPVLVNDFIRVNSSLLSVIEAPTCCCPF